MSETLQVTRRIHFSMANKGRRQIRRGPEPVRDTPNGRVPRVARLMALAIKFDQLIRSHGVYDQAELAEVGHVTRARVTQIMNLLHLAPDIQEQILFLPLVTSGRDPITERDLRPIVAQVGWADQRRQWQRVAATADLAGRACPGTPAGMAAD